MQGLCTPSFVPFPTATKLSCDFVYSTWVLFRLDGVKCIAARLTDTFPQFWYFWWTQQKTFPLLFLCSRPLDAFSFDFWAMFTTDCVAQSTVEIVTGFLVVLISEGRVLQGCKRLFWGFFSSLYTRCQVWLHSGMSVRLCDTWKYGLKTRRPAFI